jgi:two-component system sensor histidine kinase ChvG
MAEREQDKPRRRRGARSEDGPSRPLPERRFSPLTRRILLLNMLPLALLVGGVLYLGQYQRALIRSDLAAMQVQAEIVAAGLGEAAVTGTESGVQRIDPELAVQALARLVQPVETRARLFGAEGELLADSASIGGRSAVEVTRLSAPGDSEDLGDMVLTAWEDAFALLPGYSTRLPPYREAAVQVAEDYPEAEIALTGGKEDAVRVMSDKRLMLSVAVPVQRFKQVLGAVMLSHDDSEVRATLRSVRLDVLKVSGLALVVTVLLSLYLAGTIARPLRRLTRGAEVVRRGRGRDLAIPDLTGRRDEIGDLAGMLRDMTQALWARMDAIERFAADVSHELKNPLTSLRSAVETARNVRDPEKLQSLIDVIVADVRRLDRLISDISDASRLDAELSRSSLEGVDLGRLLRTLADLHTRGGSARGVRVRVEAPPDGELIATGHETRLGQVFQNLIGNALSFSPDEGRVRVHARKERGRAVVEVDDDGPGVPEPADRIFERFYSDRPEGEAFGEHSGLGLSIARQIVEAYGGSIAAANRRDEAGAVEGARFTVRLPLFETPKS